MNKNDFMTSMSKDSLAVGYFLTQEDKDFNRFKDFMDTRSNVINLKKTSELFCNWDATYTNKISGDWIAEIKSRELNSYDRLTKDGLIIEEKKFQAMLEECRKNNKKAVYVNLMKDNKLIVFIINEKLEKLTSPVYINMNKYTFGFGKKVQKQVRLLKPEMGEVYEG